MTLLSRPRRIAGGTRSVLERPPLNPIQLIELARFYADEVASGKYPFVDFDAEDRWHQRIYRDPRVDIWIISWWPSQGTQLHDHGGSSGAFSVLSGVLTESVPDRSGRLHEYRHGSSVSVGFGPRYIHDVRNADAEPAVSVHAYSHPLASMTYYDIDDGVLLPIKTIATDDPEPAVDLDEVRRAS